MKTRIAIALAALLVAAPGAGKAQEKAKAAAAKKNAATKEAGKKASPVKATPTSVKIICEWIEVEQRDLTRYLMEKRLENDATELRHFLQKGVEEGRASVVETIIVSSRSGQRAKAESVREIAYPTEYDPAQIPTNVKLGGKSEAPFTTPNPTAFETQNAGFTLEVDPVIGADGKTVDLNLAPEFKEHLEDRRYPHEDIPDEFQVTMPEFFAARITTSVQLESGQYVLLGTVRLPEAHDDEREDPIVLVFVRADVS